MKHPLYCALAILPSVLPITLPAQQVQWLTTTPNTSKLNPDLPVDVLCARDPEHVYVASLDIASYLYGDDIMGTNTLSRLGADGGAIWSATLSDSALVESIASDADGNVVLGGRYFDHLVIDGNNLLTVPADHLSMGSFLCSWDADGQLLWQRDVSGGEFDDVSVASLAVDLQGRMWAALSTFFGSEVVRLASDGSQVESRPLTGSKQIGNLSFDPFGGLYVSGAATMPGIGINGTTFAVNEEYTFFVTRMNADGNAQWLRTAHDVTFQRPRVQADGSGHAYLLGSQFDSLSWGNLHFEAPEWNRAFFLARLDSMGVFDWGIEPPQTGFQGQFEIARGQSLGVDEDGNVYVLGNAQGTVDWGNGVVSAVGGQLDRGATLLSFDEMGVPRWEVHGGGTSYDVLQDLAVTHEGICHFIATTGASFAFGPFTSTSSAPRSSVVVRVDPSFTTGLTRNAEGAGELIAYPSLFSSSFQLSTHESFNDITMVWIIDATGRIVEQAARLGGEWGEELVSGTYMVHVRMGDRIMHARVVKE